MNRFKIIIGIVLLLVIPATVVFYLTINKPQPLTVNLELAVKPIQGSKVFTEIDQSSLDKLKNIINENMIVKDQNKIIEIFNQEKTNYINLITIISVLLTVFSLFSILSSFIDKSEFQKLSQKMESKIGEYEAELKIMHLNSLINSIKKHKESFVGTKQNVLEDGVLVNEYNTFLKFFIITTNSIFEFIKNKNIGHLINNKTFYIEYLNYAMSAVTCANTKGYLSNNLCSVDQNEIFRTAISLLFANVNKDVYQRFKETVNPIASIEWGAY